MYCVIYKSYGEWRITQPFPTLREAERHRDLYLDVPSKDYVTNLSVVYIKEMAP